MHHLALLTVFTALLRYMNIYTHKTKMCVYVYACIYNTQSREREREIEREIERDRDRERQR